MSTISQLYNQATTGYVPQDVGIGGFKMYVALAVATSYDTQAPTSYLEDGSAVTDHLVNQPITLNMTINVADIFRDEGLAPGIENLVRRTQAEVGVVTKYLSPRSKATEQRINSLLADVNDAYDALDTYYTEGEQLFSFFGDKTGTTAQKDFFNFLDKTRNSKHLLSIQTAFRTYKSMALVSATPTQNNQTQYTSINLRFQEVRVAETKTGKILPPENSRAKGTGGDTGGAVNKGDQAGKTPTSLLRSLSNFIFKKSGS